MRQFLAARLPEVIREEVVAVRSRIASTIRGWRWLRPEGIHLTLRFLGEVERDRDERGRERWRSAVAGCPPFRIRLGGTGCFPPRGQARVLWVGVEEVEPGGALSTLAARLETASRDLGFPAEKRSFRPHLTLARRDRSGRADRPVALDDDRNTAGWVREVVLYRSDLEPTGARYTALETFPLSDGGEG
jgi:2'-5' RNA ligase